MEQSLRDPRQRRLAILAGLAVLCVLWAVVALWQQSSQLAPKYQSTPLFPDLPHQANNVARIHLASKSGNFDVALKPGKGWVITSRNDLPASSAEVRRTVIGVASLETLEPKTARPEWLHDLDLDAPPKGNGVLITLTDAGGHSLASVITGKSEDIGDQSGASGLYVRKADSTQSWLARSVFQPKPDVTDWYDKNIVDVERARIAETDVTPPDGPAYAVKRDKPAQADFALVKMPAGRQLAYPGAADSIGAAIMGLTFDDAKPAKGFDFSRAWRIVTRTFDGLTVSVQLMQQGKDDWATISAAGAPGKPAADSEAKAIAAKTSGWAYKLPAYKGSQLMTKLDSLMKPAAPPPAPATPLPKK